MGGYIGARAGIGLVNTTLGSVEDLTATDTSPEVTLINSTHEDTDQGREGKVIFKGQQSGGEESTLAEIEANHSGSADDEKGQLVFRTNDGSDGASPTERVRIDSAGSVMVGTSTEGHANADNFTISGSGSVGMTIRSTDSGDNNIYFSDGTSGDDELRGYVAYNHANNFMNFGTNATEAMRIIDTAAHGTGLGIGTTAPLRQLHIENTSANSEIAFTAATNGVSSLLFGDGQTGTDVYRGYIQYNHTDDKMLFGVGSAYTMSLNTAANTFGLDFITYQSPYGMRVRANGSYSHQEGIVLSTHANALRWKANMDGSSSQIGAANATAFNATSDYRLKENIEDLANGITKVKQLKPREFNWISDETKTLEDGFIAHEVATVVPSVVRGSKDEVVVWQEGEELPDGVSLGDNKLDDDGNTIPEYQGIEYGKLVPLLTKALQEAVAKIETLETKVAALEAE